MPWPHEKRRRRGSDQRIAVEQTMSENKDTSKQAKQTAQASDAERQQPALLSDILPLPEAKFTGRIGSSYADSKPDIISLPTAPTVAPNVLLVLLDDVGFGQTSTFGGPVNTPTLQRLANEGLRYNRFHT